MAAEDHNALVEDIRENGLLESIVVIGDEILDGWHRYLACYVAGIEPRVREFPADRNPVSYVISKNNFRRHETASQRAIAIVRCHEWVPSGENQYTERGGEATSPPPATNQQMADQAKVTTRTIRQAKRAEEAGLGDAVAAGEMSVEKAAAKAADKPATPKPTKVEKLQAQLAEAQEQIEHLSESVENLQDEIRMAELAAADETEQLKEIKLLKELLRTTESQKNQYMNESAQWKKEAKRWERQAKRSAA